MKILGYRYDLDLTRTRDEMGAMGRCNTLKLLIQIASDIDQQQKESTMIHEILEALDASMELNLPHQTLCQLEVGLYAALSDNGVSLAPLLDAQP